jgi:two-component system cell cycle sensor histidine kinase/response regulator CckA
VELVNQNSIWAVVTVAAALLTLAFGLIAAVIVGRRTFMKAQQKQMEELRTSEKKFRNLFENSMVGMVRLSLHDWTLLDTNEAFRKMISNVTSDLYRNFLGQLPSQHQIALKARLYEKGHVENFETQLHTTDGKTLWISFSGRVFFKDGYVEGVVNNITSRVEAEEHLRERAALLEKAHDAVVVLDLKDTVVFWNPAAERLFLWTASEAVGKQVSQLIYGEEQRSAFQRRRDELILNGEWSGEIKQRRKDGSEITSSSRWTLVRGSDGTPRTILEIHTDVTEKKLLDSKFLRIQRLESLGILAGGIAHDLNNVLAPIILSIQSLKRRWDDPASRNYLATLEESARRGAELIKEVLTFARGIEGDRVLISPENLVADVLKSASQTFPESVELESAVAKNLWTVIGDVSQLTQVLMSLAVNAKEAMAGGGRLSISAENVVVDDLFVKKNPESKPGVYVLFHVTDTGKGIPSSDLDKIFEPFYTTKTLGRGTGLGLSTALGIIKSHRGFILVESKIGFGTTFHVYIPAQLYETQEDKAETQREPRKKEGNAILVIGEDESVRESTRTILEDRGYRALTAKDSLEATNIFAKHTGEIGIVVSDLLLPLNREKEMINALRAMNPNVSIIVLAGAPRSPHQSLEEVNGVQKVLTKPYTAESLLLAVNEVLHHQEHPSVKPPVA